MIGYYNYTVLFTLFGTLSGVVGIRFALTGNIFASIICLMLCGFFDMFDGTIARTKKNRSEMEKKYGVQLDSLSDVICFGVLPTMIVLEITAPLGHVNTLCILYLITAISRLAYFNVEEEMRTKNESTPRKTYTGLPVTATAILLPVLYFIGSFCESLLPIIILIGILTIAAFQISKIKLPHLQMKGLITCLIIGILLLGTLIFLRFQ